MRVRYIGELSTPLSVIKNHEYECLGIELDSYRIIDETKEDYLYPMNEFEVIIEEMK